MRTAIALTALLLVLTGCSHDARHDGGGSTVESVDGSLALTVPDGWRARPDLTRSPVVLAATGPHEDEHLLVSVFPRPADAADESVAASTRLLRSGVRCRRFGDSAVAELPIVDCADRSRRPWMHKILVPFAGAHGSALLLVQVRADDYESASGIAAAVADSFRWGKTA